MVCKSEQHKKTIQRIHKRHKYTRPQHSNFYINITINNKNLGPKFNDTMSGPEGGYMHTKGDSNPRSILQMGTALPSLEPTGVVSAVLGSFY